ncbi:uncharacterized protein LOC122010094 isoform X2 [Zingiber officinale]|uniref:uncharacterized protein LOC122010094 isoform X2 n=1 Tax=Zingiber officinale TaxID=94328 RepID=UPI001C4ACD8B|nr:uncharacterized protein LOC122010094 isoform X2 [Zingiber officinale]
MTRLLIEACNPVRLLAETLFILIMYLKSMMSCICNKNRTEEEYCASVILICTVQACVMFSPIFKLMQPESKRVMDGPSFHVDRVESSHQPLMAGPPLHPQRAESAQRQVRALNSQFVSWVQSQLEKHPDELWEDGVNDYLSHASSIKGEFKDVVDWLRAKSARERNLPIARSTTDQKNLVTTSGYSNTEMIQSETSNGFTKQQLINPITSFSTLQKPTQNSGSSNNQKNTLANLSENKTTAFPLLTTNGVEKPATLPTFPIFQNPSLQSTGLFSFSQTPVFSGAQSENATKAEVSGDADEEDDLEKPSSPSLERTEEKGIVVVHEVKCKLYVKPDNPDDKGWKDMGLGHLSIKCKEGEKKATKDSKPTIIIRNDVGKILLNALIYSGIKMNIQKNTIASVFHTTGGAKGVVARTYLLRLKNEVETSNLASVIKDHTPSE